MGSTIYSPRYILQLVDTQAPEHDNIVMSDSPAEYEAHKTLFEAAHGSVLIIGLGIGFVNRMLRQKPEVTHITVVEKEREVIAKVTLPPEEKVILADGRSFWPDCKYDTIWWDTWGVASDEMDEQVERYRAFLRPGGFIGRFL